MPTPYQSIVFNQPEQITHSLEVNKDVRVEGEFDEIILAGMGGSGHPGDLLNALQVTKIPLRVHRSYGLPKLYGRKPLVIVSSYSGNTEEALSAYQAAREQGLGLMVNTAGGKLAEWCKRDKTPLVKIDFAGQQPRHTLFASFVGLATALKNSGLADDISEDLRRVATALPASIASLEEPGHSQAKIFNGKIPVITTSKTLSFAAQNFKIQINENAKHPAFWNDFPELNHNEMVGFSRTDVSPNNFSVLIIRDSADHPRVKARMEVTAELYRNWGLDVSIFDVAGQTLLEKMFYAIIFGFWTSGYLALDRGVDPVPVEGVESFKAKLKEVAGEI